MDHGHCLVPDVGPPGRRAKIDVTVELAEVSPRGESEDRLLELKVVLATQTRPTELQSCLPRIGSEPNPT